MAYKLFTNARKRNEEVKYTKKGVDEFVGRYVNVPTAEYRYTNEYISYYMVDKFVSKSLWTDYNSHTTTEDYTYVFFQDRASEMLIPRKMAKPEEYDFFLNFLNELPPKASEAELVEV